jgi:septum formation protein
MADPRITLVLASASELRRRLLDNAGFAFLCDPPPVDEQQVKSSLHGAQATSTEIAETLAELKAQRVAIRHPGCLVIGADQVLDCNGILYDKPTDIDRARADLIALRGKTHALVTSVVAVRDGIRLWHYNDQSSLTMRDFSDEFLDTYLDQISEQAFQSVGAYQVEARGVQLFEKIDGDYFSILGLPLLPLVAFLRGQGLTSQ